jgi:hypothetical protein
MILNRCPLNVVDLNSKLQLSRELKAGMGCLNKLPVLVFHFPVFLNKCHTNK